MSVKEHELFEFMTNERLLTLTVIGSVFTFAFVASLKRDIVDPLLMMAVPEDFFGFMNVVVREGERPEKVTRAVEIRMGSFFREFVTWMLVVGVLYVTFKYTKFPRTPGGNTNGAAIME